jgi:hypothetical protein
VYLDSIGCYWLRDQRPLLSLVLRKPGFPERNYEAFCFNDSKTNHVSVIDLFFGCKGNEKNDQIPCLTGRPAST